MDSAFLILSFSLHSVLKLKTRNLTPRAEVVRLDIPSITSGFPGRLIACEVQTFPELPFQESDKQRTRCSEKFSLHLLGLHRIQALFQVVLHRAIYISPKLLLP